MPYHYNKSSSRSDRPARSDLQPQYWRGNVMGWKLHEIPNPWGEEPLPDGGGILWEIGHCWKAKPLTPESIQSPEWKASGRDYFIWVLLPSRDLFTPDR